MFLSQLSLLLWKNYAIHKRKPGMTFVECLLPSIFAVVILILKLSSDNILIQDKKFPRQPVFVPSFSTIIGFTPDCAATKSIAQWIANNYKSVVTAKQLNYTMGRKASSKPGIVKTQGFGTVEESVYSFRQVSSDMRYIIQFPGVDERMTKLPMKVIVLIHPYRRINQIWHTSEVHDFEKTLHPRLEAIDYELLFFESLVGRAILHHWLQGHSKNRTQDVKFPLYFKRFPVPSYWEDEMYLTLKMQLTLFIVLGFLMNVFVVTKNIVQEKELKIKESMRLIGMSLTAFWVSWFITCFIFLLPAVVLYTVVLGVDLTGKGAILALSDASIIFVLLVCYCLALITFCFMISCLVQQANEGAIAAGILFLCEYVPYEILNQRYQDLTRYGKISSCLMFNCALGLANFNIVRREARGEGVQWDNIDEEIESDDFTVLASIIMLLIDTCLHLLLTWYLDNVFPGDFGVPKPFYFFMTTHYWCPGREVPADQRDHSREETIPPDARYFEKEPDGLNIGIEIEQLRKVFGSKVSVSSLTLNIYEGQITVLLGHNGAGKTTTMNMLTGFIPPTSGTAIINGFDICKNIAGVHKSLGLCPQHDILFDGLTVKEHLWFFAHMKGYKSKQLKKEINDMLMEINLTSKTNTAVDKLSGGEKRSLSVGIALMGGSKVVFLDEPSSGMDPATRRLTWDVLQRNRRDRTLLLSTHYMDEADALGDRIAIMAEGVLQCCGTPLFLKKLYGTGYHLIIVKKGQCNVQELTRVIQSKVDNAQIEYIVSMEVTYLLPDTECAHFPELFRFLNANKEKLQILSFGTTATTMEEVFLRSGEKPESGSQSGSHERSGTSHTSSLLGFIDDPDVLGFNSGFTFISGSVLLFAQFKALLTKRFIVLQRHWMVAVLGYLLPGTFVLLFIIIDSSVISPVDKKQPLLIFGLDLYGSTYVPYQYDTKTASLADVYEKQFHSNQKLVDLTQISFSSLDDYFLEKAKHLGKVEFDQKYIMGADFEYSPAHPNFAATALYNGEPYHAMFVSMNFLLNAIAQHLLNRTYHMSFGLKPLPKEGESEINFRVFESYRSGFFVGMFTGIGFAMFSSLVVHYLLRERQSGVKHMHAIFGVSMFMYWATSFLWDAINFIIPTCTLFIIFAMFDQWAFLDDGNWLIVILIMACFVWAVLPCTYAVHFIFATPSSGLAGIVIFNLFSVLLTDIMVFEFTRPDSGNKRLGKVFDWIFTVIFPTFNLSQCFNFILRNYETHRICKPLQKQCANGVPSLCCFHLPDLCHSLDPKAECYTWSNDFFALEKDKGIRINLFFLLVQGLVGTVLVFLIEYGLFHKLYGCLCLRNVVWVDAQPEFPVDESDVVLERERISGNSIEALSETDPLILANLHKKYNRLNAVDHICVGVSEKECLGLLGQSGAGKTTVFRMLTGETNVTAGNAYLRGHNVRTELNIVQSHIGYCPQYDAHIGELTARETLTLYGHLRGIPAKKLDTVVDSLIHIVLLDPHANRMCGTYSGGNKRKLSLAMSLVGDPPFIFLDEPSSGMDPKARRQMWNVLSQIRACGRTLVLSSHSMEECDALCTRLAIMLKGRFMCLGSPQHLKNKYGQGYTLIIKMNALASGDMAPTEPVTTYIQSVFPQTSVFDDHQGYLHLQISDKTVELADVFQVLETKKDDLDVQAYSVHETTLEQIFLTFTKIQGLEELKQESCWFLRAGFFDDKFCF